jgi:hypothetical protein
MASLLLIVPCRPLSCGGGGEEGLPGQASGLVEEARDSRRNRAAKAFDTLAQCGLLGGSLAAVHLSSANQTASALPARLAESAAAGPRLPPLEIRTPSCTRASSSRRARTRSLPPPPQQLLLARPSTTTVLAINRMQGAAEWTAGRRRPCPQKCRRPAVQADDGLLPRHPLQRREHQSTALRWSVLTNDTYSSVRWWCSTTR